MPVLAAVSCGLALGAGIGYLIELPRMPPLLRSVSAGLLAMAAAATAMGGLWYLELRSYQNVGIDVGLEDGGGARAAVLLAGLAVVFGLLHASIARLGRARPGLVRHVSVVVGCVGGLVGALPIAWAILTLRALLSP